MALWVFRVHQSGGGRSCGSKSSYVSMSHAFWSKTGTCILCGSFGCVTFLLPLFRLPILQLPCVPKVGSRTHGEKKRSSQLQTNFSQIPVKSPSPSPRSKSVEDVDFMDFGETLQFGHVPNLCNAHWTWSGVASFWRVVDHSAQRITWSIERANTKRKEQAQWSRGTSCRVRQPLRAGTAVVVVRSSDRFSINVWHQLTAIFEAWITPKVLQLLKVLPRNVSVSYQVPPVGEHTVQKRRGS